MAVNSNVPLTSIGVEFMSYGGEVPTSDIDSMVSEILRRASKKDIEYLLNFSRCERSFSDLGDNQLSYFLVLVGMFFHPEEDVDPMINIMYRVVRKFGYAPFDDDIHGYEGELDGRG